MHALKDAVDAAQPRISLDLELRRVHVVPLCYDLRLKDFEKVNHCISNGGIDLFAADLL